MSATRINKEPVVLQTGDPQKKKVVEQKSPPLLPIPKLEPKKEVSLTEKISEKPLFLRTDAIVPEPKKTKEKKEAKKEIPKSSVVALNSPVTKSVKTPAKITAIQTPTKGENESILVPIKNSQKEQKTALIEPAIQKIKPSAGRTVEEPTISVETKVSEKTVNAAAKPIQLWMNEKKKIENKENLAKTSEEKASTEIKTKENHEANHQDLKKIQIWEAKEGAGLKKMLAKWSEQANIKLIWNTKKSYALEMDMYVSGTFENALKTLFSMGVKNGPQHNFNKENLELVISD